MLTIDWQLTIGICLIFAIALIPVNRIGRRLRRLATSTQAQVASMTTEVTEGLSGIRMARTYRLEEPLSESADGVFEHLFGLRLRQIKWQARVAPMMEVLVGLAVAVLLFVVGLRIRAGTITIADFTALLTGLGVIAGPARRLGGNFATVQQGAAALDRVFMLFDVENTILDGPGTLDRAQGRIRFEGVHFAYPDGHVALEDFDLTIEPGRRVAFVGRSGAGKSTVFNLLPRLYDPTAGRILIDGHDIRALTLASLRDQIAVVEPGIGPALRHRRRRTSASAAAAPRSAEIEAAARDAAADGFIRALPQGYDTPVVPTAGQFSGGERQRLSIARAILRDAPDPAPRRAHLRPRRRERGADPRRARPAGRGPHHPRHRPPPVDGPRRRPHRGHGPRPHRRAAAPTPSSSPPAASTPTSTRSSSPARRTERPGFAARPAATI